jgi:hypothetical protein
MQSGYDRLIEGVRDGLAEVAPLARAHVTSSPPIVGAALLGLDELEAGADAQARARREFHERLRTDDEHDKTTTTEPRPTRSG